MGFRIGDVVQRKDADGRPHKIVDIKVHHPLNRNEHTFFQFIYMDGESDSFVECLKYYDGKYKLWQEQSKGK